MIKTHFIAPYSIEKNFGKAINVQVSLIPDEDWVAVLDGDAMFLTPDWGQQVSDVVNKYHNKYSLIGCMTNRLGRNIQRHKGEFSNNFDIKHHYDIAVSLRDENYGIVKDITDRKKIAGMFMLFPKSLWNTIKFEENTSNFDDLFSAAVIKNKGRLGLMTGLYMFHCYRIWSDRPKWDDEHLK